MQGVLRHLHAIQVLLAPATGPANGPLLPSPGPCAGGSSGWQAPEQLIARDGGAARQTRSMDVFSLGCILHYCLTGTTWLRYRGV